MAKTSSSRQEYSYGVIPLRKQKGIWHVLLIQHGTAKYWGFPKGHAEQGESPQEAAVRELEEETNLTVVNFLSESVLKEHYHFTHQGCLINKTVWFYIAEVQGEVVLQKNEVSDSRWVELSLADQYLTFENERSLCRSAAHLISY